MDTQRRTKIVATLGPATDDPGVIAGMVRAGVDVARINFSHGTRESQRRRVEMVRHAAREAGRYVGLLADLSGPKIRIESFRDGKVQLLEGAPFVLDTSLNPEAGTSAEVGVAYKNLTADVHAGDTLLLSDGQIVLEVEKVEGTRISSVVRIGGELSNRKGLNRQGGGISAPAVTERIWRTSAWRRSSASIISRSPLRAMPRTCAARNRSCASGAAMPWWWQRSSGTRRWTTSQPSWR